MKIDSRSNLIRLVRRFAETNETKRFTNRRFAMDLNKYFNYYINEEITKLIKRFNYYEKTTKSKIANINYQNLYFAKIEIIKKEIAIIIEVDINQKYLYCYHFDFKKNDFKKIL